MALRDYLSARRSEIEAQIKQLKAELLEIKVAENAISGEVHQKFEPAKRAGIREGSIKDWILKVLDGKSEGLETDEIISVVSVVGGPSVTRSSMTPQLSRLKSAGFLTQEDRRWRLADQAGRKNETPDGHQPSGASNEEVNDLLG